MSKSSTDFLEILRKGKVVKVLLPIGGGNYDVATFKMDEPFSDDKLKNVK